MINRKIDLRAVRWDGVNGQRQVMGFCERDNEFSESTKGAEYVRITRNLVMLKWCL